MPRYALTVAYDGTDFCGWQKQEPLAPPEGEIARDVPRKLEPQGFVTREGEDRPRVLLRSVQQVLEQAVREVVREPVALMGASRTDAGVHARGQVAAFTCTGGQTPGLFADLQRLVMALNSRLPEDALVLNARLVDDAFDPIAGARAKGYSYALLSSSVRPLWTRRWAHQVREALDVAAMHRAAQALVGEHDFAAFAAAGHGRLSTVRTIFGCSVREEEGGPDAGTRVRIDVSGNGFLYNMVRIIGGTLVEVGRGRMTAEAVAAALSSKDRRAAGPTLPPQGLCLEWVRYTENAEGGGP